MTSRLVTRQHGVDAGLPPANVVDTLGFTTSLHQTTATALIGMLQRSHVRNTVVNLAALKRP